MSTPSDNNNAGDLQPKQELIGYGKPPVATQFKPGCSGNPRGRPRKLKRDYRAEPAQSWLGETVLDEAYRDVTVMENGRKITMPAVQTVLRASIVAAAKGSRLHAKLVLDHVAHNERLAETKRQAIFVHALQYKADWQKACALAAKRGTSLTPHLPHPDDVLIDPTSGTVRLDGPSTPQEQHEVDARLGQRDEMVEVLRRVDEELERSAIDPGRADNRQALIARIDEIDAGLPQRLQLRPGELARRADRPVD